VSNHIPHAEQVSLREAGFDEFWLQDQIYDNPALLGLGELEALSRERRQSSGGRLDLLLKNPEDDSMYEVEIMLGETDETHIIRTIEYWDIEKRRWPQRQHFAVLVAERINRRFFNVIHLLSNSIPIIAIQAALVRSSAGQALFLTKVLDTFEELDDGTSLEDRKYNREYWVQRSSWSVEIADRLLEATRTSFPDAALNYLKYYIAVIANGRNLISVRKRSGDKSLVKVRVPAIEQDEVAALMDANDFAYVRKAKEFLLNLELGTVKTKGPVLERIVSHIKRGRDKE
jgi:hypothetical protein